MSQIAGPGRRRPADPGADRAVRDPGRRGQLPVVGVLGRRDPSRGRRSRSASPTATWAARSARGCGSSSATGCCARSRRARARPTCSSNVAFPVFFILLARNLHLSAGVIGLFTSVAAVGGLLGSLRRVADRPALRSGPDDLDQHRRQHSARRSSCRSCTATGRSACWPSAQLVMWGSAVVYNITQVSFRQGLTPERLLGRMNATMRFFVWGTIPLGAFLGGVLGSTHRRPSDAVGRGDRRVVRVAAGVLLAAAHDARAAEVRPR